MSSINLIQLENSINKNKDLIDLNLEKLNEDFLVDNFKEVKNLKNTELRKEFNQLCKNKAESKTIEETSLNLENKKIFFCRENQVRDIPPILNPIFTNFKKLYLMGVPMKNSLIHAIHNIVEVDFLLKGPIQKEKILDEFRNKIVLELDTLFKTYNYKTKKYKKSTIRDNLLSSKVFLPQTINTVADYFDICLLVIDADSHLYSLANDYNPNKKFVVMIRKNNTYQPILNTEGNHYFEPVILDLIETVLKPEIDIDKTLHNVLDMSKNNGIEKPNKNNGIEKPNKNNGIEKPKNNGIEKPESKDLGKEKDYKLVDLHKIAEKLDISIYEGSGKKKKLKSVLYSNIKEKY
jgi:hypothetical protein